MRHEALKRRTPQDSVLVTIRSPTEKETLLGQLNCTVVSGIDAIIVVIREQAVFSLALSKVGIVGLSRAQPPTQGFFKHQNPAGSTHGRESEPFRQPHQRGGG